MRKKWMLSVLSLVLMLSMVLAGCGGGNAAQNGQTGGNTENGTTGAGNSDSTNDGSGKLDVQLKFLSYQDNFDPETDHVRGLIKDLLGVEIIPFMGREDDKVNMIISSGQEFDMISLENRNLLAMYAQNEAIQPLTDLIDQYGPNLKEAFTEEQWDMVSVDGEIYALPSFNYDATTDGLAIRKDWLDKLGMPLPTTPDELYEVLKAFKEQDPGGVGKDKVIPFAFPAGQEDNIFNISGLAEAFGIGSGPTEFVVNNGEITAGLDLPGAKQYVGYLKKLHDEGLLDPDAAAMKYGQVMEKVGAGVVGVATMSAWDSGAVRALKETDPNAELVFLPPFKDENGEQKIASVGGLYSFIIVPTVSKKAEEVVKYANAFLDPDNYTRLILGEENVSYKIEDGKYYPIFPEFDKFNKGRWFYPVNDSEMYTPLFGARARKEPEMAMLWDEITSKTEGFTYIPIVRSAPLMEAETQYGQKLRTMSHERFIKMLLNDSEFENFDKFVQDWKESGGQELTDQYNAWYQSQ